MSKIKFLLNHSLIEIDFEKMQISPTTTVLNYLRELAGLKGAKEGCAEGDCGACTIVIAEIDNQNKLRYKACNSCLIFLPNLHGKQLITVEGLKHNNQLHPVQQAMIETDGSQCGYCTPGFIMSLFALYKNHQNPTNEIIIDALTGNLCRCTGYRAIIDAAKNICSIQSSDHFTESETETIKILNQIEKNNSIEINTLNQKYYIPSDLNSALQFKQNNPESIIISGNSDIGLRVTKKKELLNSIIDLSFLSELKSQSETSENYYFGAGLNLEDIRIACENKLDALSEILKVFGAKQVRTVATLGGNIGSASPIGDTLPVLMAYSTEVVLISTKGERQIELKNFITGYRTTVINKDEIIKGIIIPKPKKDDTIKSYKISKRKDLDISTVSGCFRIKLDSKKIVQNIGLYYGGMSAYTKSATKTEEYLKGKEWTRENIEKAMLLVDEDFSPISDARSGEKARKIMARNLLLKFWTQTV